MNDLVERLREPKHYQLEARKLMALRLEAADRIEALTARLAGKEATLRRVDEALEQCDKLAVHHSNRADEAEAALDDARAAALEEAAKICDEFARSLRAAAEELPLVTAEIAQERARSAEEHAAAIRALDTTAKTDG